MPFASPTKASGHPVIPPLIGTEGGPDELEISDSEDAPFSPFASQRGVSTRHNSLASTDIEILPPPKSEGAGPSRPLASRSRSDLMASWITESVPTANYPLNDAGKALTIEGFLELSCFEKGDVITRGLLAMSHIRRWDFFLQTSPRELETKLGFPYPIACQLIKGANWLIPTHVIVPNAIDPNPKGHTTAATQPDLGVHPPANVPEATGSKHEATSTATVGLAGASACVSGPAAPAPTGSLDIPADASTFA
ncbi:hypothetical protein PTTG_25182 [Puccinia triticina 1-1 BBBD Race 1]|uniref:Uncharacterized protein n=1 Tax=Puccinia triticina (isolate 1-1 / race 1 (BBBD)) TaxID=630390 RepID=A0A180H6I6_PUCT1|nr:hypothetical protein PTTG_25182 [Puccinia triticina 1-1 BBBD Race 1]